MCAPRTSSLPFTLSGVQCPLDTLGRRGPQVVTRVLECESQVDTGGVSDRTPWNSFSGSEDTEPVVSTTPIVDTATSTKRVTIKIKRSETVTVVLPSFLPSLRASTVPKSENGPGRSGRVVNRFVGDSRFRTRSEPSMSLVVRTGVGICVKSDHPFDDDAYTPRGYRTESEEDPPNTQV